MKKLLFAALLVSGSALAQDLGSFTVYSNSFQDLFNKYRVAQPTYTPWAGSFFSYSQGGTGIKLDRNGDASEGGLSPMDVYGQLAGVGAAAQE